MTPQAIVCPSQFENLGTDRNWDGETLKKANGFLHQLECSSLVCFKILLEVLSGLRELTLKLQMQAVDVIYAYRQVRAVVSTEREFKRIFAETNKLTKDLHGEDFELSQPRVNRHQMHQSNVQVLTVEEYYRITIYNEIPFARNCRAAGKIS